jgi:serine/threonine protein kinase
LVIDVKVDRTKKGMIEPKSYRSEALESIPIERRSDIVTNTKRPIKSVDDYEIIELVGEGTFGRVYRARQKSTGLIVALKNIILDDLKEGFPITSLREIKLLRSLKHSNIISLIDVVTSGDVECIEDYKVYMVFPYMEHDLTGLLDSPNVQFSPGQIKCYIKQLLEGVNHLHTNHLIHRDMKSANILINNMGELKIGDFGLARTIPGRDEEVMTGGLVTRWYRPPELLIGEPIYNQSVDIWGVGCIILEIFIKRPAFRGNDDINQLDSIIKILGLDNELKIIGDHGSVYFRKCERRFREIFVPILKDEKLVDLVDRILQIEFRRRITAKDALKHDYFTSEPRIEDHLTFPSYPPSHELDKRKRERSLSLGISRPQKQSKSTYCHQSPDHPRVQKIPNAYSYRKYRYNSSHYLEHRNRDKTNLKSRTCLEWERSREYLKARDHTEKDKELGEITPI